MSDQLYVLTGAKALEARRAGKDIIVERLADRDAYVVVDEPHAERWRAVAQMAQDIDWLRAVRANADGYLERGK
jgi:hypothetical protein